MQSSRLTILEPDICPLGQIWTAVRLTYHKKDSLCILYKVHDRARTLGTEKTLRSSNMDYFMKVQDRKFKIEDYFVRNIFIRSYLGFCMIELTSYLVIMYKKVQDRVQFGQIYVH